MISASMINMFLPEGASGKRALFSGRPVLILLFLFSVMLLSACERTAPLSLEASRPTMEYRQMQTRLFDTTDEKSILIASAALLQDMGYTIDEAESGLGVLVASKRLDAVDGAQMTGAILLAIIGGVTVPVDSEQTIRASIITTPHGEKKDRISARVTFQRVIINTQGNIARQETINDAELYQEFFNKLSQSVFLEAHTI